MNEGEKNEKNAVKQGEEDQMRRTRRCLSGGRRPFVRRLAPYKATARLHRRTATVAQSCAFRSIRRFFCRVVWYALPLSLSLVLLTLMLRGCVRAFIRGPEKNSDGSI